MQEQNEGFNVLQNLLRKSAVLISHRFYRRLADRILVLWNAFLESVLPRSIKSRWLVDMPNF
jgi:hypothetical protein